MSQVPTKETNPPSKKAYHSPQLQKFGKVSELTLTSPPGSGNDGGGGATRYNS